MSDDSLKALDETVVLLVAKLADYQASIAALTAEAEAIKTELRKLAAGDYADPTGMPVLRITPQRTFDVAAAVNLVPEAERKECFSIEWDAKKVRARLTPLQVDTCMVTRGEPKVALL